MLQDMRSKLLDVLAMAAGMTIIQFVRIMLEPIIERFYGKPGLLVFAFTLMASSIFCLDRATTLRFLETWRARSGILGGLMMWAVVELALILGNNVVNVWTDAVILTLGILVIATLWRRSFTTGLQFFALTFLFGWMGRIILGIFTQIRDNWSMGIHILDWAAVVFGMLGVGCIVWVFIKPTTRIQRLFMAIVIWFCSTIVIFSIRGIGR